MLISTDRIQIRQEGVAPNLFIRAFHRLQERVRAPAHRARLARIAAALRPPASARETPEDQILARDGVTFMPGYLSAEQAAELRTILAAFPCQDPWKPEKGMFALEDAPEGTHVADIPAAPTLKAIHDIAFDERLIGLATRYFGCRPFVDSVQAWWSLSGNAEPQEAENFHRDNDSIRFLKFFLYLTDVGPDQGPHRFVRGSHAEAAALERRRLTDEEVEAAFGEDRMLSITGRPGDAFMEDTFGVHKGQLPRQGVRLLVQVRYSVMPSIFRSPIIVHGRASTRAADSLLHAEA